MKTKIITSLLSILSLVSCTSQATKEPLHPWNQVTKVTFCLGHFYHTIEPKDQVFEITRKMPGLWMGWTDIKEEDYPATIKSKDKELWSLLELVYKECAPSDHLVPEQSFFMFYDAKGTCIKLIAIEYPSPLIFGVIARNVYSLKGFPPLSKEGQARIDAYVSRPL